MAVEQLLEASTLSSERARDTTFRISVFRLNPSAIDEFIAGIARPNEAISKVHARNDFEQINVTSQQLVNAVLAAAEGSNQDDISREAAKAADALYWTKSAAKDEDAVYKNTFRDALRGIGSGSGGYVGLITKYFQQKIELPLGFLVNDDTILEADITDAVMSVENISRKQGTFENSAVLTFSHTDLAKKLSDNGFKNDVQVLPEADTQILENDVVVIETIRTIGISQTATELTYVGFVGEIDFEKAYAGVQTQKITCYGLSKLLGLTKVISDAAVVSQYENGEFDITASSFTPFQNAFSNATVYRIFSYIMQNQLALAAPDPNSIDDAAIKAEIVASNAIIQRDDFISQQRLLIARGKTAKDFVDISIQDIDKITNRAGKENDAREKNKQELAAISAADNSQSPNTAQIRSDQATIKLNIGLASAALFKGSDIDKSIANDGGRFNSIFTDRFGSEFRNSQTIPSFSQSRARELSDEFGRLEKFDSAIKPGLREYLVLESRIRQKTVEISKADLDALNARIDTLSGTSDISRRKLAKIDLRFDAGSDGKFTNITSFRTMYQLLFLYLKVWEEFTDDKPVAVITRGTSFAYNRLFKTGWKTFYSQTAFAEEPLRKIRELAFYDVFESERNQIICRPSLYNTININEIDEVEPNLINPGIRKFVIDARSILTFNLHRNDIALKSRVDYHWFFAFSGNLPFIGGFYTDFGIMTKYGMRADDPKSNPNVVNPRVGNLYAAMDLARQNASTRRISLTVINDRHYELGRLYFIITQAASVNPPSDTKGFVGYLVSYTSAARYGQALTHTLEFTYVREAIVTALVDDLGVPILNFKRLPELNEMLDLIEGDASLTDDASTGRNVQDDKFSKQLQSNLAFTQARVGSNGCYIAFSKQPETGSFHEMRGKDITPAPHDTVGRQANFCPINFRDKFGNESMSQIFVDLLFFFNQYMGFGPIKTPSGSFITPRQFIDSSLGIDLTDNSISTSNIIPGGLTVKLPVGTVLVLPVGVSLFDNLSQQVTGGTVGGVSKAIKLVSTLRVNLAQNNPFDPAYDTNILNLGGGLLVDSVELVGAHIGSIVETGTDTNGNKTGPFNDLGVTVAAIGALPGMIYRENESNPLVTLSSLTLMTPISSILLPSFGPFGSPTPAVPSVPRNFIDTGSPLGSSVALGFLSGPAANDKTIFDSADLVNPVTDISKKKTNSHTLGNAMDFTMLPILTVNGGLISIIDPVLFFGTLEKHLGRLFTNVFKNIVAANLDINMGNNANDVAIHKMILSSNSLRRYHIDVRFFPKTGELLGEIL